MIADKRVIEAKWKRFWSCSVRSHRVVDYYRQKYIVINDNRIGLQKKFDHIGCETCKKTYFNKGAKIN